MSISVVFWTTSTIKDEKSAAKFHYIKTVSGKVVAHSIAFRPVSIYWQGNDPFPWNLASKWPALSCQWYPMGDVGTHNSRTDSHRIFKLGGGVDNVTRHVWPLTEVKRLKVKVTRSRISSNNAITKQRMVVSTANLVEIVIARGTSRELNSLELYACGR